LRRFCRLPERRRRRVPDRNDGLNVPAGWQCDGVSDCTDGEDELDCTGAPPLACGDGTSVPSSRQCDGVSDCEDGEDERDCTRLACG
jgi:hypothetical protein